MTSGEFSGQVFDQDYEIQDLFDDNGIIQTYRAFQKKLKRIVAIHMLAPTIRSDPQWRQALVRGAEIAAQYSHPNIVPVFERGLYEEADYVVLRLLTGGTLEARMQQGKLDRPTIMTIVKQIATALDYVHSQGGCHGDPAPINIVFDELGNAYLSEFYLLGLLETTALEMVAGVPAYMAPERMSGQKPDAWTDQYAFAGVVYYMLTGVLPWEAKRKRSSDSVILPQVYQAEIPLAVNEVLLRGLANYPEERYPTIMDFARQFEAAFKEPPQHLFISYSRRDSDYVQKLKTYLQHNGLSFWMDDQIEHGDQWFHDIHQAIKTCAAFLVVMSPEAEQSEWVHKEILLAKRYQKPIFPLLLRGAEMPILIDLQFADVRNGEIPEVSFHRRLSRAVYGV